MAVRVDKYLGLFQLETGGMILGWLYLIASFVIMIIFTAFFGECFSRSYPKTENILFTFIISLMSLYMIYISYTLISGIKKRESDKVKPAMITTFFATVYPISLIFFGFPPFIIAVIINLYDTLILYSLWAKFKDEEHRTLPVAAPTEVQDTVVPNNGPEPSGDLYNNQVFPQNSPLGSYTAFPNAPPQYEKI